MFYTATVREMFCKNCGSQLSDGSKFCTICGTRVAEEIVQPAPAPVVQEVEAPAVNLEALAAEIETPVVETAPVAEVEAPVVEEVAPVAEIESPVAEPQFQPDFAQFEDVVPAVPAKKSKKFLGWLIPAIAVVVAAAVVAALLLGPLKGWRLKAFGNAADYRDYVQQNTTETATGEISAAYGELLSVLSGEYEETGAAELSVKLNVGPNAVSMLEDLAKAELGEEISMDWARDIELSLSANAKDQLQQIGAKLNIGGEEIAVADAILDMDQGMLFLAVLNLSDEYLALDVSEYLNDEETAAMMEYLQDPELIAALPSEEVVGELLNKYVNIVLSSFDNVDKSTETVEVGDLEQKLTVLETKIDGDDLVKAAEAVLEELANDKQVEKVIRRAVDYLEGQEDLGFDMDADDVCEEFYEAIEDALDALGEVDGDDLGVDIVLTQYVNGAHEAVGYALEVADEQVLYFVEIKDGDKLAFELNVPGSLEVIGEGTEKKGVVNADYVVYTEMPTWDEDYNVTYEKTEVLTISLVDFKAEDKSVNGKIRLAPSSAMLEEMGLSATATSAIDLAKIQLELGFATGEKSGTIEFNVLTGEDLLVGVSLTAAEKKASDIELPEEAYGEDAAEEWLEGLDTEKILDALDKAGLPIGELFYGYGDVVAEEASPIY